MKKEIIALFLAIIVAASATAHGNHGAHGSQGSGLSVGLDGGLHIHKHEHEGEEAETHLIPNAAASLSYSEGFLDDKLEFDIGVSYNFAFSSGYFDLEEHRAIPGGGHHHHHHDGEEEEDPAPFSTRDFYQQVLYLNAGLTWSIDIMYFSTLSFILENETGFYLVPWIAKENSVEGTLKPGIKWNWALPFDGISARYDAPLKYVSYFEEEKFGVGGDVTVGWESKFGLGIEVIGRFVLVPISRDFDPDSGPGFDGVDAMISYTLPIKKFSLSVGCEFEGIGIEEGFCIVPMIGFRYNF